MALYLRQSEKSHRFMAKLEKEYFLSQFNPLQDYSIATIFKHLPEQSQIVERQELISPVPSFLIKKLYNGDNVCG